MRYLIVFVLMSGLAACGPLPPPPDTGHLPVGTFAPIGQDQDVPAIETAKYAFAVPARTRNNPLAGAQAALALEYIAGELNTSGRWDQVSAPTKMELLQGRKAMRAAVGIAPDAPSQAVIDSLATARTALSVGNETAAINALDTPAFPNGGAATIKVLTNLPYISMANISTMHAAGQIYGPDSGDPLYRD